MNEGSEQASAAGGGGASVLRGQRGMARRAGGRAEWD